MTTSTETAPRGTGINSLQASVLFRHEVGAVLQGAGLGIEVRTWQSPNGDEHHDAGDILGIPGLTVTTTAHDVKHGLGHHLATARERARGTGTTGVVVQKKAGADVREAYVVLALEDFARVARHLGTTTS